MGCCPSLRGRSPWQSRGVSCREERSDVERRHCEERSDVEPRHCEERSDVESRHCEEQRDVAIQFLEQAACSEAFKIK